MHPHPHGLRLWAETGEWLRGTDQWLFRKTGTMGTLASQAEIGVKHRDCFCVGLGVSHPENFKIVYAKSYNMWHFFGRKMIRNAVDNARTANYCAFLNT